MQYNQAREIVHSFVKSNVEDEYQLLHAEMVETAMLGIARNLGEDETIFGLTGLIHDWDYFKWPETHPGQYEVLLNNADLQTIPIDWNLVIEAIKGHGDLSYPHDSKLSQALLACDEFSGLLYAYNKMVGSYKDMKVSSVSKKLHKELNFAAKANREDMLTGIQLLGIPEEEFIDIVKTALSEKYD